MNRVPPRAERVYCRQEEVTEKKKRREEDGRSSQGSHGEACKWGARWMDAGENCRWKRNSSSRVGFEWDLELAFTAGQAG